MLRAVEDLGVERMYGRPIRFFELSGWTWEPPDVTPFVLFVAARSSPDDELAHARIRRFAADAVKSGCGYVCTWGEGCERVHDLFDEASIASGTFVISSYHPDESLSDVVYFSLNLAWPDEAAFPDAHESAVVMAVEPSWSTEVRRFVDDQDELARLWSADG